MKVRKRSGGYQLDLASAVSASIRGVGYRDATRADAAERIADEAADAIGKLVMLLHTKGILSPEDVEQFLSFEYDLDAEAGAGGLEERGNLRGS